MSLGSSGLTLGDLSLGGGADVSDVSLGGGKGLTGGGVSVGGLSGESFVDEMSLNHHPRRAYSLDSFHYHNPSPPWGFGGLGYGQWRNMQIEEVQLHRLYQYVLLR